MEDPKLEEDPDDLP